MYWNVTQEFNMFSVVAGLRNLKCLWACRYLCVVAGLTSEADYVFIPEWPPERDWPAKLCRKLQQARSFGLDSSVYETMCLVALTYSQHSLFISMIESHRVSADKAGNRMKL
jgi:hypothetical protein